MKLYIKHMVSLRCKMVVKEALSRLGVKNALVELGVANIRYPISPVQIELLKVSLNKYGLELLDDKKSILVERIKNLIIEMIHDSDELPKMNYSDYLSEKTGYNYTYLSNVFSSVKGITIQQFIILHKIEKIKQLMQFDELSLTEISYRLHYSSVAHLSNQFKKMTGIAPTRHKKLGRVSRTTLENL